METKDKQQDAPATATAKITPQDLYVKMGELGMQDEQKQFEDDVKALQSSLAGQGDNLLQQYEQTRKKGLLTSGISTVAGAVAGGLLGMLFSNRKSGWGNVRKGAVTLGSGVAGASAMSIITSLPMRKQMGELQNQASGMEEAQAQALSGIVNKYQALVEQRTGAPMLPTPEIKIPESPGAPAMPDNGAMQPAEGQPSPVLANAAASQLVSPAKGVSV